MNHPEADQLRRFLAEELSDSERAQVEAAIKGWDNCREPWDSSKGGPRGVARVLRALFMTPGMSTPSKQPPTAPAPVKPKTGGRKKEKTPAATVPAESEEN